MASFHRRRHVECRTSAILRNLLYSLMRLSTRNGYAKIWNKHSFDGMSTWSKGHAAEWLCSQDSGLIGCIDHLKQIWWNKCSFMKRIRLLQNWFASSFSTFDLLYVCRFKKCCFAAIVIDVCEKKERQVTDYVHVKLWWLCVNLKVQGVSRVDGILEF